MKLVRNISMILLASALLAGCSSTTGIIAHDDGMFFMEPPKIVYQDGRYFLRFRYSYKPVFAMYTDSKISLGRLVFYIPVTASSGNIEEMVQYEEIISEEKIWMIQRNMAYWEQRSTVTRLSVEYCPEDIDLDKVVRKH